MLYWLAPNWVPGLVSIAWLPWFWWAWTGRLSPLRCLAISIFVYLAVAGGWPATWLMLAALGMGLLGEELVLRDRDAKQSWLLPLSIRSGAAIGGVFAAVVTVLPLLRAADFTVRSNDLRNGNFLVPNLADVLGFASPALHGEIATFGAETFWDSPIYFAAWFALPVLWMVPWGPSLIKRSGVVSGAISLFIMTLLTQAPSELGPLRNPVRSLAGVQFFLVVTVVALACAGGLILTRVRVGGLAASTLAIGWLTWSRDPADSDGLLGMLVVAALVVVLVVALNTRPTTGALVAGAGSMAAALAAFQLNLAGVYTSPSTSETVGNISLSAVDRPVLASYGQADSAAIERWFADGVGRGFQRLSAGVRLAPGYSSIRQVGYSDQLLHHVRPRPYLRQLGGACSTRSPRPVSGGLTCWAIARWLSAAPNASGPGKNGQC